MILLTIVLILLTACTISQPAPTSTPLPPTELLPPTDTSVPPTQTPNPYAEEVLLAFAEAINNQEYEKAKSFFSEDFNMKTEYSLPNYEGIQSWLDEAEMHTDFYRFSDFVINADSVEFEWFFKSAVDRKMTFREGKEMCEGLATMKEDKIVYLQLTDCETIK